MLEKLLISAFSSPLSTEIQNHSYRSSKCSQHCNVCLGQGSPSQEEWEERILHLSMDILSECMLGIRLSGHSFIQWRFEVLKEER